MTSAGKAFLVALMVSLVAACGGAAGSPAATAGPTTSASAPESSALSPAPSLPATTQPIASTPIATTTVACVAPPSGLLAWWRAEDDARDAVGANVGTLKDGAAFGAGTVGRAFTLDGTSQYVEVAGASDLQLKTAITIEGWVYAAGAPKGYAGIAGTWDDNTGANRTYLFWALNGALEFVVSPDGGSYQRATDPTALPLDAWVHVAATYDGTMIRLYRDGVEVASAGLAGRIAINSKSFLIGRTEGGSVGPNFWKGSIDELTVYGRALDAAEIAAIHAAGSTGKCKA